MAVRVAPAVGVAAAWRRAADLLTARRRGLPSRVAAEWRRPVARRPWPRACVGGESTVGEVAPLCYHVLSITRKGDLESTLGSRSDQTIFTRRKVDQCVPRIFRGSDSPRSHARDARGKHRTPRVDVALVAGARRTPGPPPSRCRRRGRACAAAAARGCRRVRAHRHGASVRGAALGASDRGPRLIGQRGGRRVPAAAATRSGGVPRRRCGQPPRRRPTAVPTRPHVHRRRGTRGRGGDDHRRLGAGSDVLHPRPSASLSREGGDASRGGPTAPPLQEKSSRDIMGFFLDIAGYPAIWRLVRDCLALTPPKMEVPGASILCGAPNLQVGARLASFLRVSEGSDRALSHSLAAKKMCSTHRGAPSASQPDSFFATCSLADGTRV